MTEQNSLSSESQDSTLPIDPVQQPPLPELPKLTTKQPQPRMQRIPAWRFWAPLLIQLALLVAVPFKSAVTYATGQTVTLKTAPVDPYDMLRGYSQTLRFDISDVSTLKTLPGGAKVFNGLNYGDYNQSFYVTLEAPQGNATAQRPEAWKPVAISGDYPEDLMPNQIALRGEYSYRRATYGLETYYMPENQRNDINSSIRTAQSDENAFVVNVKIDDKGNSVPESLWVRDQEYRF